MDSGPPGTGFQPFLRFWKRAEVHGNVTVDAAVSTLLEILVRLTTHEVVKLVKVSTLLEILHGYVVWLCRDCVAVFQPFLRFYQELRHAPELLEGFAEFQPFLRFYGLGVG